MNKGGSVFPCFCGANLNGCPRCGAWAYKTSLEADPSFRAARAKRQAELEVPPSPPRVQPPATEPWLLWAALRGAAVGFILGVLALIGGLAEQRRQAWVAESPARIAKNLATWAPACTKPDGCGTLSAQGDQNPAKTFDSERGLLCVSAGGSYGACLTHSDGQVPRGTHTFQTTPTIHWGPGYRFPDAATQTAECSPEKCL